MSVVPARGAYVVANFKETQLTDVRAGQPYTVGEQGPEIFVPQSAGAIQPNGGGGHPFNITVNGATGADHAALAQRIKKEIMAALPGRRA